MNAWAAVALVLALACGSAVHAEGNVNPNPGARSEQWGVYPGTTRPFSSPQDAAASVCNAGSHAPGYGKCVITSIQALPQSWYDCPLEGTCSASPYWYANLYWVQDNATFVGTTMGRLSGVKGPMTLTCPANATKVGSVCTCDAGFSPTASGNACQPSCAAGLTVDFEVELGVAAGTPIMPAKSCYHNSAYGEGEGCVVERGVGSDGIAPALSVVVGVRQADGSVAYSGAAQYHFSGGTCDPGVGVDPGPPEETGCPSGQAAGYINEQRVCYTPTAPTEPARAASGPVSGSASKTEKTTNPDGSSTEKTTTTDHTGKTTEITTTCDSTGAVCTTVVTSMGGDGDGDGEGEEQKSECELHPNTIGCMEPGTPGEGEPTGQLNKTLGVTPQSGWGPSTGACPAGVVTTSLGTVDVFGLFCQYLEGIRMFVIGWAWLSAAFIVLGFKD